MATTGIGLSPVPPMQPPIGEFQQATGIAITNIKDLSTPTIPQAAMAEALTRSPDFDIVHLGSEMIPSLVSAGYLEPLDDYMKKANYKMDAVGDLIVRALAAHDNDSALSGIKSEVEQLCARFPLYQGL